MGWTYWSDYYFAEMSRLSLVHQRTRVRAKEKRLRVAADMKVYTCMMTAQPWPRHNTIPRMPAPLVVYIQHSPALWKCKTSRNKNEEKKRNRGGERSVKVEEKKSGNKSNSKEHNPGYLLNDEARALVQGAINPPRRQRKEGEGRGKDKNGNVFDKDAKELETSKSLHRA